ncbi:putative Six-hairpin glycosidase-like protein [Seiridium unicorne]|uniref:Six-hairpin glycosidase-like protein n=1 Tax=Seiridium unicorne TaxID=138068 RepID=A0ABR2VEP4_9PEZI
MATTRKRVRYGYDNSTMVKVADTNLLTPNDSSDVETLDVSTHGELSGNALNQLYSDRVVAKIWGIASKALQQPSPPLYFPEYTKPGGVDYVYRELGFWTSGFFPGSLHLLLERERKFKSIAVHGQQLAFMCKWWTEKLHQNAYLATTHDLGFMIAPWAKIAWELNHDLRAFETLKAAAKTLHGRFKEEVGLIRSWDTCVTKRYRFLDPKNEFLTVIDNMMNLDLLFYVARHTGDRAMHEAAVQHARTTQRTHIRKDFSTTHLVTFDPTTGDVRERLTNQGYTDTSCWTRGQAWAIAGFAETYHWTHDRSFLDTARSCANYFLRRLPASGVPPWDFDAADDAAKADGAAQPPDVSAAVVTAYGLLLIHQALISLGQESEYLSHAMRLIEAVTTHHMNPPASFIEHAEAIEMVERPTENIVTRSINMGGAETILNGATINNHEYAPRRWANHGLVYADYYFLLVGNKLLEMDAGGIVGRI